MEKIFIISLVVAIVMICWLLIRAENNAHKKYKK